MTSLTESVSLEKRGDIALVVVDNPPVNALSHHVRQGILDGMQAAQGDDEVEAIVLTCRGRTFIAGADISEFGQPPQGPPLPEVQSVMESSTKPVVAAIHGTALGGGFEVAMCANYRVAVPTARFGFPEVKLGLLPGAGGTQRLPRVVGAAKALDMVVGGDPIDADEALELGLIDAIARGQGADAHEAGAIDFARRCIDEGLPLKRLRDLDDKVAADRADPGLFDEYRQRIARRTRGFKAPEYNIRCIEAAVQLDDFDAGIARERELFQELVTGTQSAAQRYYFFAEREAAKIPDVPRDTPQLDIRTCGVLGAGTMGGGIAMNFANVGIPVTIVERDQESLDRGLGVVRRNYERSAARGSMPADAVEERMALISGSLDRNDFADVDIVIEAVFEDLELKKSVFADLDGICKPDALLATNTSALDVDVIAGATSRPESVIGMHFFSPANVMKLLEVVRGDKTSNEIIASTMALAKRINKIPVLSGVCHGFIGNRMLAKRRLESDRLILEGATPAQVDKVVYDFGFPMGPYAMSDLAGLDIGWKAETSTSSTVREIMCESGRRGQKNGRGYYTYDPETRAATPDHEVERMIRDFAAGQGIEQREVTDTEVLERCLLPMVNEGCKILDEGIAIRASDIDVVWVNGYGWPVYTGGPMFWADTLGLGEVVEKIRRFHQTLGGEHWEPADRWAKQQASGRPLHTATAGEG
jgi:3-hydroxyacyl-CoA dehydrogenase